MRLFGKILRKVQKFFYFGNRRHSDYIEFLGKAAMAGRTLQTLHEYHTSSAANTTLGLRHDVDVSLDWAIKMGEEEYRAGAKATYFILHTAEYFFTDIRKRKLHHALIEKLKYLQNDLGHEIGLHTDLITAKYCYGLDQMEFLRYTLELLRKNGIKITGISSHGSLFLDKFSGKGKNRVNTISSRIMGDEKTVIRLDELGIEYEAGTFKPDLYFSDAQFVNGRRCDFSNFPMELLSRNTSVIVSTHPIHWAASPAKYYIHGLLYTIQYTFTYVKHYMAHKQL